MTQAQFDALLAAVKPVQHEVRNTGNFAKCSSRFGGANDSNVDAFVDAISVYKDCMGISDENALKGIPMLLNDQAATWWQGIKHLAPTFDEAIRLLKATYGVSKPAYQIYLDIFSLRQDGKTKTDVFICKVRALFAQLPAGNHTEDVQLDMIYGLLNNRIREKVSRTDINSFDALLTKARQFETFMDELSSEYASTTKKDINNRQNIKRQECTFCDIQGHTTDDCRKRLARLSFKRNEKPSTTTKVCNPAVTSPPVESNIYSSKSNQNLTNAKADEFRKNEFICYGCETPGIIRRNCKKCNTNVSSINFPKELIDAVGKGRPMLRVKVYDRTIIGLVDTASDKSIANKELQELILLKNKSNIKKGKMNIRLADGSQRYADIGMTTVPIELQDKTINTTFMMIEDFQNPMIIFGIDFLADAGIVLDIKRDKWNFIDNDKIKYELMTESKTDNNISESRQTK